MGAGNRAGQLSLQSPWAWPLTLYCLGLPAWVGGGGRDTTPGTTPHFTVTGIPAPATPATLRSSSRGFQGPLVQEGAPVQPPVSPPFLYLLCTKVGLIRMPPELKAPLPMNLQDALPAPRALQSFPSRDSGPPGNRVWAGLRGPFVSGHQRGGGL